MIWSNFLKLPRILQMSKTEIEKIISQIVIENDITTAIDIGSARGYWVDYLRRINVKADGIDICADFIDNKRVYYGDILSQRVCELQQQRDFTMTDGLLEHFTQNDIYNILHNQQQLTKKVAMNIVPKDCVMNVILEKVQRVPKEYRRATMEWFDMHKEFYNDVDIKELQRVLVIICKK